MVGGGHLPSFLFWGEACSWMGPRRTSPPLLVGAHVLLPLTMQPLLQRERGVIRPAHDHLALQVHGGEAVQKWKELNLKRTMLDEGCGRVGRSHPSHTWRSRGVAAELQQGALPSRHPTMRGTSSGEDGSHQATCCLSQPSCGPPAGQALCPLPHLPLFNLPNRLGWDKGLHYTHLMAEETGSERCDFPSRVMQLAWH